MRSPNLRVYFHTSYSFYWDIFSQKSNSNAFSFCIKLFQPRYTNTEIVKTEDEVAHTSTKLPFFITSKWSPCGGLPTLKIVVTPVGLNLIKENKLSENQPTNSESETPFSPLFPKSCPPSLIYLLSSAESRRTGNDCVFQFPG